MTNRDTRQLNRATRTNRRKCLGRIDPGLVCIVLLLVFGLAALGYLVYDRKDLLGFEDQQGGGSGQAQVAGDELSEEDQLDALREEFDKLISDKMDTTRIEARIRVFTEHHPDNAGGYQLLGMARISLLQWDKAHEALSRSLQLSGDNAEAHRLAGTCAAEMGNYDQAREHYLNALQVAGPRASCVLYRNFGQLYLMQGELDAAEQAFTQSLDAPPPPGEDTNWKHEGYSGLANVASERGDLDAALQNIQFALILSRGTSGPAEVDYEIQKARIYFDAGQDEQAINTLISAAHNHRGADLRIEAARLRARIYERAGDMDSAVEHIKTILQLRELRNRDSDAQLAEFYALLAEWQIRAGQDLAALNSIDVLRGLSPNHPQIEALRSQIQ